MLRNILIALVIAILSTFGGYRLGVQLEEGKCNTDKLKVAESNDKRIAELITERDTLAAALMVAHDKHLKELEEAQNETNDLRNRIAAGTFRLYVATTDPTGDSPGAATGSEMGIRGWAELAEPARQAYLALREGISKNRIQLRACQDELRLRTN